MMKIFGVIACLALTSPAMASECKSIRSLKVSQTETSSLAKVTVTFDGGGEASFQYQPWNVGYMPGITTYITTLNAALISKAKVCITGSIETANLELTVER